MKQIGKINKILSIFHLVLNPIKTYKLQSNQNKTMITIMLNLPPFNQGNNKTYMDRCRCLCNIFVQF